MERAGSIHRAPDPCRLFGCAVFGSWYCSDWLSRTELCCIMLHWKPHRSWDLMERNNRIQNPQAQALYSHVILFDSALIPSNAAWFCCILCYLQHQALKVALFSQTFANGDVAAGEPHKDWSQLWPFFQGALKFASHAGDSCWLKVDLGLLWCMSRATLLAVVVISAA